MSTAETEQKPAEAGIDDDLVDYEDDDLETKEDKTKTSSEVKKGSYAGIHTSGFRDFLLKPEILQALSDCGFEHPSQVQQTCIPQAMNGIDIICQAKSGMGKTAVFVLATLQQIRPEKNDKGINIVDTLVLCHTRELAYQICQEYERFSKYLPAVKVAVIFGGIPQKEHIRLLKEDAPHIVVGCPGRVKSLVEARHLKLDKLKRFILDECDSLLEPLDMRGDVQSIFTAAPYEKQVMMFSATLSQKIRPVCRKFTQNPEEILVDDEKKLTLRGLQQYYAKLEENEKNRKLCDLLDALDFNQVVIFVNGVRRCKELNKLLQECNFPTMAMMGRMKQEERLERYNQFKEGKKKILVSTDIFGRGVDFERVNIVINYDMPKKADDYLHRVGRSGRFGTKGLAITFVSTQEDSQVLEKVQERFEVAVKELPDEIDVSTYMTS